MAADPDDACGLLLAAIGPEAAARLREEAGGSWVYVPERASARARLTAIIGLEAVQAAIDAIGCGEVYIRSGHFERLGARDRAIRARRLEGASIRALARAFGLSDPQVRAICRGVPCGAVSCKGKR